MELYNDLNRESPVQKILYRAFFYKLILFKSIAECYLAFPGIRS